jgi:hypothetical protein
MFMGKPRHASRFHSLTVAIALAVMGLLCLPSSGVRASEGQWKYGGNSTFKVYWQNTLRVENTTNLSILGNVGLLKVGAKAKVSGASWGIPSNALILGPWGEWIERWSLTLQAPAASLQVGDTYIPTMSGLYLAGRSLYGGVGSAWGTLGRVSGTVTGFYGTNAVSSGLSMSSYLVRGGSIDAGVGKQIGLSLRGLSGERDGFDVHMGGAQIWAVLGPFDVTGELVGSKDNLAEKRGYTALAGARFSAFGGTMSLTSQYTSEEFVSLSPAVSGKAGGTTETSASWSGNVMRSSGGHAVRFAVTGTFAADNMDGSEPAQNVKSSAEAQLTLIARQGQLVKGKYVVSHENSDDEPSLSYTRTNHVASIESAFPVKMGQSTVDVGARAMRSIAIDHVGELSDTLSILSVSGAGSIGEGKYAAKAGWSQSIRDIAGPKKRDLEASLSLSHPILNASLTGGLDAIAYDSRTFALGCAEPESVKDTIKAGLWLRYTPKPWIEAMAATKATWVWRGAELDPQGSDRWIEGEIKLRF